MMQKTIAATIAASVACSIASAEPLVHTNFDLNYEIGVFCPEFRFACLAAPLEIMFPAASQAPLDFIGSVPENAVAFHYRAETTSTTLGWRAVGGDPSPIDFPSNIKIIDGPTNTVHIFGKPTTSSDFVSPKVFLPGDSVGPGQPSSRSLFLSTWPTVEGGGFGDYWFVPSRYIMGVTIQETDGIHYGFIEFEDVSSYSSSNRDYQAVRWGYETTPDTPYVIPNDCGLADSNRDNTLDFFDVSIFLSAYTDNRFAADLNNDSVIDFFDVSAFLSAYTAGCP